MDLSNKLNDALDKRKDEFDKAEEIKSDTVDILAQFLEGPPLRQLMLVEKSNGLEAPEEAEARKAMQETEDEIHEVQPDEADARKAVMKTEDEVGNSYHFTSSGSWVERGDYMNFDTNYKPQQKDMLLAPIQDWMDPSTADEDIPADTMLMSSSPRRTLTMACRSRNR